jgi:hypothetical protein
MTEPADFRKHQQRVMSNIPKLRISKVLVIFHPEGINHEP